MDSSNSSPSVKAARKLSAANVPMLYLTIGKWQMNGTKNAGENTAKVYYNRRQLIWEVLLPDENHLNLKSKMILKWDAISAIKFTDDKRRGVALLELQLDSPPQFCQENPPQRFKYMTWSKNVPDFTNQQATIIRVHNVIFDRGVFDHHYEQILQCDRRLFQLSLEPYPHNASMYFSSSSIPSTSVSNLESSSSLSTDNVSITPITTPQNPNLNTVSVGSMPHIINQSIRTHQLMPPTQPAMNEATMNFSVPETTMDRQQFFAPQAHVVNIYNMHNYMLAQSNNASWSHNNNYLNQFEGLNRQEKRLLQQPPVCMQQLKRSRPQQIFPNNIQAAVPLEAADSIGHSFMSSGNLVVGNSIRTSNLFVLPSSNMANHGGAAAAAALGDPLVPTSNITAVGNSVMSLGNTTAVGNSFMPSRDNTAVGSSVISPGDNTVVGNPFMSFGDNTADQVGSNVPGTGDDDDEDIDLILDSYFSQPDE